MSREWTVTPPSGRTTLRVSLGRGDGFRLDATRVASAPNPVADTSDHRFARSAVADGAESSRRHLRPSLRSVGTLRIDHHFARPDVYDPEDSDHPRRALSRSDLDSDAFCCPRSSSVSDIVWVTKAHDQDGDYTHREDKLREAHHEQWAMVRILPQHPHAAERDHDKERHLNPAKLAP